MPHAAADEVARLGNSCVGAAGGWSCGTGQHDRLERAECEESAL